MSLEARATAFVTGAAEFLGAELVRVLVAHGHQVFGLTESLDGAEAVRIHAFADTVARLANLPLQVWRVPTAATRFVLGPLLARSLTTDSVFANIRLRGIGFRFRYAGYFVAGLRTALPRSNRESSKCLNNTMNNQ